MTDLELLTQVLEHDDNLTPEEREAFQDWAGNFATGKWQSALSQRQRGWLDGVAERLQLDPGAANLVSSGKVKVTEKDRASMNAFLGTLQKSLLPPHRRPKP